jgi:hypothetical protein
MIATEGGLGRCEYGFAEGSEWGRGAGFPGRGIWHKSCRFRHFGVIRRPPKGVDPTGCPP